MTDFEATFDVVIIGAGPAGSAAGALLARQGHSVLCLERATFPRYVIGESLLPRCNDLLASADLLESVDSRGYMVKHGARFLRGEESVRFAFAHGLDGDAPAAYQVPRDDFDSTLAHRAAEHGVDLRFEHQVESVHVEANPVRVEATDLSDGRRLAVGARFLLDCSGYGRVLPRLLQLDRPSHLTTRTALFTMVEGDQRPAGDEAGDIWICVAADGTWVWIIPFADGRTSVGAVAEPERLDALEGDDEARLLHLVEQEPNAAVRLESMRVVKPTGRLGGWSIGVERLFGPRWALTGNAGLFLDPVFSSGVTLALESASLAAELVDRELDGQTVDWQESYAGPMQQAAGVFDAFIRSWYDGDLLEIFLADNPSDNIARSITSVLGGNVLNRGNSLVRDPTPRLQRLHQLVAEGASSR